MGPMCLLNQGWVRTKVQTNQSEYPTLCHFIILTWKLAIGHASRMPDKKATVMCYTP